MLLNNVGPAYTRDHLQLSTPSTIKTLLIIREGAIIELNPAIAQ